MQPATILQILLNDVGYAIFLAAMFTSTSYFEVPGAPQYLPRVSQVMFYDFSRQFTAVNRAAWLAQSSFIWFGAVKIGFGLTHTKALMWLFIAQGTLIILLALVNDDIQSDVHYIAAFIVICGTPVVSWFKLQQRDWNTTVKQVLRYILCVFHTLSAAIMAIYQINLWTVGQVLNCTTFGSSCKAAPALSFGYQEWAVLIIVFGLDMIVGLGFVDLFIRKKKQNSIEMLVEPVFNAK